ncbi:N-acetylneuraminate synthase family protein [Sediminibacterium goheungense]|uniref:N-acetylneuraminate synthase n=1 Tax=Sediminibacterium goheungense TaxID=1086393 RepID=A0A4R6IY57_9BACT|nr:N-acetylneuraminate synthase family protein [Sediminibacterium goheungense]TDO26906.1 N-acetylneuraminate synthase [Sediminibacterium goheungense]
MNKIKLTPVKDVYNYCKPYIIAELGSNHNGDMELARKLIIQAKEAGADCVKFQSWSKDTIFSKKTYEENYFVADDYRNRTDYTLEQIVEEFSISEEELLEMKAFADQVGIDCTSTPFSKKEADFLVDKLNSPFIKVASMDLNNYPFLEYLAKKNRPMILSTGLSELYEIDKAIRTIENTGNTNIIILHCVSIYPPKDEQVNLRNIITLQNTYPKYPIGFSDHTLGTSIPIASAALGVCVIEKHFTLDKNMFGWDHKVSATKDEMALIVSETQRVNTALGDFRISCVEDQERKSSFRRSITSTRSIKKGEIINAEDIDFKRPGNDIAPEFINFVIGRVAANDIESDKPIKYSDLV